MHVDPHSVQAFDRQGGGPLERCFKGIDVRHAAIAAGAALLLCFGIAGTAVADGEAPSSTVGSSVQDQDSSAMVVETTEIDDRVDHEDGKEVAIVEPKRCDGPSTWVSITSKQAYHIPSWWNGTKYKDGPGGTMTVSVTKSGTISSEMTVGAESEMSAVIAKAKVSVSAKIAGSVSVTTGHTYSRNISNNKYGHLQYGSWGYKVSWVKYRSSGNGCDGVKLASGQATLPTSETGWKYWETSS
ncbi:hypothetical protein AB0N14_21585 [Streptomyces sp. NPDC051104]|uniref:hypothetical protein n=1 Tax=Streptomyces sp. NPDC051104 TaxID=3155044 RepID=UPI00341E2C1F